MKARDAAERTVAQALSARCSRRGVAFRVARLADRSGWRGVLLSLTDARVVTLILSSRLALLEALAALVLVEWPLRRGPRRAVRAVVSDSGVGEGQDSGRGTDAAREAAQ